MDIIREASANAPEDDSKSYYFSSCSRIVLLFVKECRKIFIKKKLLTSSPVPLESACSWFLPQAAFSRCFVPFAYNVRSY